MPEPKDTDDRLAMRMRGLDTPDLAALALGRVAAEHGSRPGRSPAAIRRATALLHDAALGRGRDDCEGALRRILLSGVDPDSIADEVIPEVARRLGQDWVDDTSSFAEVTLGCAQLQLILHALDPVWDRGHSGIGPDNRPLVLLAMPKGAQHTLGATVLSTQLRRRGCSVQKMDGLPDDAVRADLSAGAIDAVLVSASLGDDPADIARTIAAIRDAGTAAPPIVIGGTLLQDVDDLAGLTGADHATDDLDAALSAASLSPA